MSNANITVQCMERGHKENMGQGVREGTIEDTPALDLPNTISYLLKQEKKELLL